MATSQRVNMKEITLTIKLPRMFGFRMRLTLVLLKLAALISPTTIEIVTE